MSTFPLIAVDVGNSRTKLGYFAAPPRDRELPAPSSTLELPGSTWPIDSLREWLAPLPNATWSIASVNRAAAQHLEASISQLRPDAHRSRLAVADLPLAVDVPQPERVGIDRLLGALAANHLRNPNRAAVVLHVGTAITANLVTPNGAFAGGAILPGLRLSAQALHDHTDLLPRIDMAELAEPPPVVGTSTESAIASGLFWGAVGSMRELAARLSAMGISSANASENSAVLASNESANAEMFLTGGAAPIVAHLLGPQVRLEPHLVLAGVALAANSAVK